MTRNGPEMYIVPCRSNFPRYEEDDEGNRIPKDVVGRDPPTWWGSPTTKFRIDVPVVANSPEKAVSIATESEYVLEPLDVDPYVPEYLGEMPDGSDER